MKSAFAGSSYVLVTAAYNEERFIEQTIQSVISQTIVPAKWMIVSDGSTDRTDEIVTSYSRVYPFIQLHRILENHPRNFAAQVNAICAGYSLLDSMHFEFMGNLDADISIDRDYFEFLLRRFHSDPDLGLAGGYIQEKVRGVFRNRPANTQRSVAHAIQFFRRECFDEVGNYTPLRYGGPDWVAEVRARQLGWTVRAYPNLPVRHLRPTAQAEGLLRGRFRQGRMDYSVGSLAAFELLKCVRRLLERPLVIGAIARYIGFCFSSVSRAPRLVSDDFVCYLRKEQRQRLRELLRIFEPGKTGFLIREQAFSKQVHRRRN